MKIKEIKEKIENIKKEFVEKINAVSKEQELEDIRVKYLGRKGKLNSLFSLIPKLDKKERSEGGKLLNLLKEELQVLFINKQEKLKEISRKLARGSFDPSLPGRIPWIGTIHPITLIIEELCSIFRELGFEIVTGPEIENDFYNFEALNIPKDHPARDMQDTLYITDTILLRTHTSPLQIRSMLAKKPPLAIISPGKVYRRDADLTHSPMFHQIEGLLVDIGVTMAHLKAVLNYFLKKIFSQDTSLRFRPSFFPFTEPSAEVDITCVICKGKGVVNGSPCRVCKQTGWVEILGCGMVDPEVFKAVGYDVDKYTGFAFGLGVERIAMLKYGINDLRLFFDNDIRFLNQFRSI